MAAVSRLILYDIPVLSELNPPKMACSSSALNYSGILTEDDITGASLARLNPWSPGFFADVEPGAQSFFSLEP